MKPTFPIRCICEVCRSRIEATPADVRLQRHGDMYSYVYVVCCSCLQRTVVVSGYESNPFFACVFERPGPVRPQNGATCV